MIRVHKLRDSARRDPRSVTLFNSNNPRPA